MIQKLSTNCPHTPPTFLVAGTNDRLVPVKISLLFYEACLKGGVSVEMHILDNGPHGFGMGTGIDDATAQGWPMLALRFIRRTKMKPIAGSLAAIGLVAALSITAVSI